ncbi:MAG: DNA repair protein RecO [Chromatiaceae bacterium]|nr:DNA repair protein RecO [Candidatus Thioaporhodococcus sediminis]
MAVVVPRETLRRCFVLHRRDYSNTSLLLDLFAADGERMTVLARGAKRGRASLCPILQPFQPLWASWSGRGEVKNLNAAEAAGPPLELPGPALYCGLYLNELLTRLLVRGDTHPDLFVFYHGALQGLAASADLQTVLRQFELRLLEEMGYAPHLAQADDGPVQAEYRYLCAPDQPPRRVLAGEGGSQSIAGATLLALAAGTPLREAVMARQARDLLRRLLAPHLGPKPLKSRELFRLAQVNTASRSAMAGHGVGSGG